MECCISTLLSIKLAIYLSIMGNMFSVMGKHLMNPLISCIITKSKEINLLLGEPATPQMEVEKKWTNALNETVFHWRSRITLNLVAGDIVFDKFSLPADVHE